MAPLHHHFELLGWPETTVIVRFWILAGLFAALGPRHLLRGLPLGGQGLRVPTRADPRGSTTRGPVRRLEGCVGPAWLQK